MEEELDVNKIAAEFVQANIEGAWGLVKARAKDFKTLVRSRFESTYRDYLKRLIERHSKGKSFFVRTEPVPLHTFFVPLDLATQMRLLTRPAAPDVAAVASNAIITGTGGSGKTMMMRHLLLTALTTRTKTPVFFELRQLNQRQESLRTVLLHSLQANGLDIDDAYLEVALGAGHFMIMLDGFDELQHSLRKQVAREIQDLAQRYPGNWMVMSSRPDSELEGWGSFTQFVVRPLDLDRAIELVEKLPFDDPIKTRFIADLRSELFARHESFLANPLLLSIMLLTYSDVAHIPSKLSIFYSQAYDSLFQRHDALKGGFQRERKSALDIQDFGRVFAALCIQSYDRREFSFPRLRALELLEAGKKLTHLDYEPQAVLDDALQAVCLLIEDGMDVAFAHRSFQEYFAARFINSCPPEIKAQLVKRFAPTIPSDAILALLHEMDPYVVECHYVLPALQSLRRRLRIVRHVRLSHYLRFVKIMYVSFNRRMPDQPDRIFATIADTALHSTVRFIWNRYARFRHRLEPEQLAEGSRRISDAYRVEFGDADGVLTKTLTSKSQFLRTIFEAPGFWGVENLRAVLAVEGDIRRRHEEAQNSLDAMLATRSKS